MTSKLANASITIQMPLQDISSYNMTKYQELSAVGIDGFNSDTTFYNSRCKSFKDPITQKDTTPSFRLANYYLGSAECSAGCSYNGIDKDNYIQCHCPVVPDSYIGSLITNATTNILSSVNIGIVVCFEQIFTVKYYIVIYVV